MKRKMLAAICALSMVASMGAATTVFAEAEVKATGDEKIALITMDSSTSTGSP